MPAFITVQCQDNETQTVNIEDISAVKPADVNASRRSAKRVDGCIIERRSSEWSIWSVQPYDEVVRLMEHAGTHISKGSR